MTPNIYNMELWNTSGHAEHYKANMFCFDIEKQEFGLKPMNCPGAPRPSRDKIVHSLALQGEHAPLRHREAGVWAQAHELPRRAPPVT